jgi:hypothetical protein
MNCSLHLQGHESAPASFRQEIEINGQAGQTITLSFWVKVEQIGDDVSWPQATLTFVNQDGTTTQVNQPLTDSLGDWRNFEWKVEAAKPFRSIQVSLESGFGSWSVWIDLFKIFVDNTLLPVSNSSFEN